MIERTGIRICHLRKYLPLSFRIADGPTQALFQLREIQRYACPPVQQ